MKSRYNLRVDELRKRTKSAVTFGMNGLGINDEPASLSYTTIILNSWSYMYTNKRLERLRRRKRRGKGDKGQLKEM